VKPCGPRMVKISIRANSQIKTTALTATAAQPSAGSRSTLPVHANANLTQPADFM
jgi:hypothetical protein